MFTCAYWPFLYHFFEQCLFKSFAFGLFFFLLSSYEFIYILDTGQYVIQCVICKYFLPFYELSCHFLDNVLCSTEVFNFDEVHLFFFLWSLVLSVLHLRNHCLIQSREDLLLCFLLNMVLVL